MLTVIFGAGASYDSDPFNEPGVRPRDADRPPLADELFEGRPEFLYDLQRFPQCGPIVYRLRELSGRSIEQVLEEIEQEGRAGPNPDPERIRQLAAVRFYLQVMITHCEGRWLPKTGHRTNYLNLLDEIRHFGNNNVTLVTFNYDRLLEHAIEGVAGGGKATTIDDYLKLGRFALFKVHGSVDWGRVVTQCNTNVENGPEGIAMSLINDATAIKVTDEYRLVQTSERPLVRAAAQSEVLFPAIAVPIQTKQEFECPASHLTDLRERLKRTTHLLIVGWRGMDQHFVRLLKECLLSSPPTVQIVSKGDHDATEVQCNLEAGGINADYRTTGRTFSQYVRQRAGTKFLTDAGRAG